jgi:hypothetical protein
MHNWRSAANRLKVAINYAKLGNDMRYLEEFFSSPDLEAVLNDPRGRSIRRLFYALLLISKTNQKLYVETLNRIERMDIVRHDARILSTVNGLLREYEAKGIERSQRTRLAIAGKYEESAELLAQGGFYSVKIKRLRLKSARLRAIYYAHDPNQLQKSYDYWEEAAYIAKELEDDTEYGLALANQKKVLAEIALFKLTGQKELDVVGYRDVANLYDEAATLFKKVEAILPDSFRRKTAADEARICEAFSALCRFFADGDPIDYKKASPVLEEILALTMQAEGSPRSILRKVLFHSAKVEFRILVDHFGDNLVKQVWNRYRNLERELNNYAEENLLGFHGPKPLDFFLGAHGIYRGLVQQVDRIFDEIYSKIKHIEGEDAVKADESTKARAVELAEDIAKLETFIKTLMSAIKTKQRVRG